MRWRAHLWLQDHDWADCVNAFQPAVAKAGEVVIRQGRMRWAAARLSQIGRQHDRAPMSFRAMVGDEGDIFYIVEAGSLDVWIKAPGTIHPVRVRTDGTTHQPVTATTRPSAARSEVVV